MYIQYGIGNVRLILLGIMEYYFDWFIIMFDWLIMSTCLHGWWWHYKFNNTELEEHNQVASVNYQE